MCAEFQSVNRAGQFLRGKVVVVDDEEYICMSCIEVLQDDDYEVKAFTRADDALRYLDDDRSTDLVLLDLKMTEADGIDVLRHIKKAHPETMVVIITGYATAETAVASLKLGAFDYVSKPFTPDELTMAVGKAFENRRQLEEKRRLNEQRLMRSEKLASIGRLAAGIAHEINNPLTSVLTFSSLMLKKADGEQREKLEIIVNETTRCREIVRGLLNFARQSEPRKEECDINKVIEAAISLTKNQLKVAENRITVVKALEDVPSQQLDPNQMLEVFVNIIINALDAMSTGGQLSIGTRLVDRGRTVEIKVADTGYGIPKENLARVFDPFFTTKEPGKGTGLGLAVSYGIIDRHNGTIDVESEPGKGTTFTIRLPLG